MDSMAYAPRSQVDGIGNMFGTATFACMNGDRDTGIVGERNCFLMNPRRTIVLRSGEIESNDTVTLELGGKLGHFDRLLGRLLFQRGEKEACLDAVGVLSALKPGENRGHDLSRFQIILAVQERCEPRFDVDDILTSCVFA